MRTFIVLLVLTNLAYFGWNQGWLRELAAGSPRISVPAPATVAPQPIEQAPAGLTLVSELTESERERLLLPAQTSVAETPAAAAPTDLPLFIEETALGPENVEETPQNQIVEEALERLIQAPAGPPWCANLGPFAEASQAEALIPSLTALGLRAELHTDTVPVSSTFWVYMPAFATEDEARRMLAELQERNIDSYYMRNGEFPGGISLGVFSRRASAETVRESLAAQGYTAQIGEVFREEPRSSLALRAPDEGVVKAPGWADFMAKNAALTLTENVCESVASPTQFP